MFGIKIISEERYLSEQTTAQKLIEINDELTKKNVRLQIDIKALREQNSKLRSINAKRKDDNDALVEKNRKLNEVIDGYRTFLENIKKAFPDFDFRKYKPVICDHKCEECSIETENCKKYTDISLCLVEKKPSFRGKK